MQEWTEVVQSVEEALTFFGEHKKIKEKLDALMEVGLPYLSLGQPLSTFSGGERQRVKLADYIIDVGPDGGTKGGRIVFTGTPGEMLESGTTITAKYLKKSE